MTNDTLTKLKEIAARVEKATSGDWIVERIAHDDGQFAYEITDTQFNWLIALYESNFKKPMHAKFTSEFIAHSREDVVFLLTLIDKQARALEIAKNSITQLVKCRCVMNPYHPDHCAKCMALTAINEVLK